MRKYPKSYAKLVFQGKLSAAIKLLDSDSSTGLLNITPEVLEGLKEKHPEAADIAHESLFYRPIDYIPPGFFDLIDEKTIFDATTKTKGSAGPSGIDAELYRRILCSKNFKAEGKVLREEIAVFKRNLLKIAHHPSLLEGFASCRLIPLDKNPGIRPIGVGEVLGRICWKTHCLSFEGRYQRGSDPLSGLRRP